ncbi:malonic semialdehyde reductase [Nitrogeniibacter mangrovi]|uniref:Putative NADH dehydrogenase/NAD(P)H nitroreductase G3580_19415 n=1 Tax=Nitrogeniibacter mangrovi TaxID=2016596 RepID=A0A6C1BBE4_9RHOO|nr:malonic semialdehyde reductase [Nitrogeniibacter mangrovi]QID19594.1 malonic semialdehyde reductase [Nitrogeniibacter mangrovi]
MKAAVSDDVLQQAFLAARTFNSFSPRPVDDATVLRLYDLLRWGPTSMNCQPARYVFVRSTEAKARLTNTLAAGNVAKTMAAPLTVIVAMDTQFYEHLPSQFPHSANARDTFANNAELARSTAFRNSTLQGAYLIMAARLLGLDCGPMSGFDADKLNAEFFPDGRYKANFLVNLGYGDPEGNHPRGPRLAFDEVARIL